MESGETARVEQRWREGGEDGLARRIKKGSNGKKREIKEKPVQSDGRDASLRINR